MNDSVIKLTFLASYKHRDRFVHSAASFACLCDTLALNLTILPCFRMSHHHHIASYMQLTETTKK